jgi:hypothetical protein
MISKDDGVSVVVNEERTKLSVGLYLSFTSWDDPGLDLNGFPKKTSRNISPPGKPEGNIAHRVHHAVSPEIALWMIALVGNCCYMQIGYQKF